MRTGAAVIGTGASWQGVPPTTAITPAVAAVYGVQARVEACSRGLLQVLVDDEAPA